MRTVENARGKWFHVLSALGVDEQFLVNRHGPCPLCGGKDRFRFDDRDGSGSYFCNQCGPGPGLLLLQKLNGWDYRTACDEIDRVLGTLPTENNFVANSASPVASRDRGATLRDMLDAASHPHIAHDYLRSRGLSVTPRCLRGHCDLPYFDDGRRIGQYPAMVASVHGPGGELESVHRTYLADVTPRKKLMKSVSTARGGAVRLFEHDEHLGVAEGIETAIAARELFDVPTWAMISASLMKSWSPPMKVRRVTVFADNDANLAGQQAAYALADRLTQAGIPVDVKIPDVLGADWLDVLNERRIQNQSPSDLDTRIIA